MRLTAPRLVVAGLAGDSGKTLVSLGLTRVLASRGLAVSPYKKGPDYIDAGWLEAAAGRAGRNLDSYLMDREAIGEALARGEPSDLVLVEGNRGLYDGLDAAGRKGLRAGLEQAVAQPDAVRGVGGAEAELAGEPAPQVPAPAEQGGHGAEDRGDGAGDHGGGGKTDHHREPHGTHQGAYFG